MERPFFMKIPTVWISHMQVNTGIRPGTAIS